MAQFARLEETRPAVLPSGDHLLRLYSRPSPSPRAPFVTLQVLQIGRYYAYSPSARKHQCVIHATLSDGRHKADAAIERGFWERELVGRVAERSLIAVSEWMREGKMLVLTEGCLLGEKYNVPDLPVIGNPEWILSTEEREEMLLSFCDYIFCIQLLSDELVSDHSLQSGLLPTQPSSQLHLNFEKLKQDPLLTPISIQNIRKMDILKEKIIIDRYLISRVFKKSAISFLSGSSTYPLKLSLTIKDDSDDPIPLLIWDDLAFLYYYSIQIGDLIVIRHFRITQNKRSHPPQLELTLRSHDPKGSLQLLSSPPEDLPLPPFTLHILPLPSLLDPTPSDDITLAGIISFSSYLFRIKNRRYDRKILPPPVGLPC